MKVQLTIPAGNISETMESFDEYGAIIYGIVLKLTHDRQLSAEEILCEIFLEAQRLHDADKLQKRGKLPALVTICRNKMLELQIPFDLAALRGAKGSGSSGKILSK